MFVCGFGLCFQECFAVFILCCSFTRLGFCDRDLKPFVLSRRKTRGENIVVDVLARSRSGVVRDYIGPSSLLAWCTTFYLLVFMLPIFNMLCLFCFVFVCFVFALYGSGFRLFWFGLFRFCLFFFWRGLCLFHFIIGFNACSWFFGLLSDMVLFCFCVFCFCLLHFGAVFVCFAFWHGLCFAF